MDETLTVNMLNCSLRVTASYDSDTTLSINYTVLNNSTENIYLCRQLIKDTEDIKSTTEFDSNLIHIQVKSAEVYLDKAIMDLSFREDIKALDIPLLIKLQAGNSVSQTIKLELPLYPYKVDGQQPKQSLPELLPMYFSISYFYETPEVVECLERQKDGYYLATIPIRDEQRLTVGPFKERVQVANTTNGTPLLTNTASWTPWGL